MVSDEDMVEIRRLWTPDRWEHLKGDKCPCCGASLAARLRVMPAGELVALSCIYCGYAHTFHAEFLLKLLKGVPIEPDHRWPDSEEEEDGPA